MKGLASPSPGGRTVLVRFDLEPVDEVSIRVDPETGTSKCAGDGISGTCPCDDVGAIGHGCASSFDPAGALLRAVANANVQRTR